MERIQSGIKETTFQTYPLKEKQTIEIEPNWILLMENGKGGKRKFEFDNKRVMRYARK